MPALRSVAADLSRIPGAGAAALGAIVLVGLALRLTGIRYGLPYPLLNPDEGNIVPRAWRIGHAETADPSFYDYPSLLFYLLAPVQALLDAPSYLAARIVGLIVATAGIAATWWLARTVSGRGAAIVAAATVAVATTHVAYSRVAVTDVLLTLLVTTALALAVSGRIELAGLAVGAAASAKYPGILAAVPVLVAGWPRVRRLLAGAGLAAAAYAVTSPFTLVHLDEARADLDRVQALAREGWLGFEDDPPSLLAFGERLWEGTGPVAVVALVALVTLLLRRPRRTELVLASFVLAYGAYLAPLGAHFDRYVLPLVPVVGVLAGSIPRLRPLAALLLVVPFVWAVGDARELTRRDSRLAVVDWVDANLGEQAVIAADPSALPDTGRPLVRFALPRPGHASDPQRDLAGLRRQGVDVVVVSGAVTDRVLAARRHYPGEAAFYDALTRSAELAFEVVPDAGIAGPWVRVYALR